MKPQSYKLLPLIILLLVLLATYFVWRSAMDMVDIQRQERFDGKVSLVEAAIRDRLAIYSDAQYAGAGFFLGSTEVTRHDWYEFVKAIHILKRYPGINGLGFAMPVKLSDTAALYKKYRNAETPDFKITTYNNAPPQKDLYVITYIEPYQINKRALGFDMGSEPRRRKALEEARDLGMPVITQRVHLIQDSQKRPAFLMYVPFYKDGAIPNTIEERRKNFIGWVYAPFIVENFVEAIRSISFTEARELIHIEIFDGNVSDSHNLIYESADTEKAPDLKPVIKTINLYNRNWTLRISPTKELAKLYSHKPLWVIWFGGGLLSLSLFYVVYLVLSMRRHALEIARSMTMELRRQKDEMQQKNMELERSNMDLEQFAYVASHDLKEPLRMVNIYTQLLANKYESQLDDEGKSYIQFASQGAVRMGSLINDLLMYAKLSNNTIKTDLVDIKKVIENVEQVLQPEITESGAEINIVSPLPKIKASENHINSLFQNIISNSIKYHSKQTKPLINISAVQQGAFWLFSICDNGIGMEKEHLEKIFVIFQRLHQKDEYTGTGIGLAICKKIVEFHGGKIWAESMPEKGTTIYFTLPAMVEEEKPILK